MGGADRDDALLPDKRAVEGAFDAQLSFPAPFVEAPEVVKTIIKRDGREAPFDEAKIAEAIFNAAQSIGGEDRDRAESLASGVAIYLMKTVREKPPTVDQVHDAVEKVLIEMGHAKTALVYARSRDKRDRIRRLREGDTRAMLGELQEARRERERRHAAGALPAVRTSGDRIVAWDRKRIVTALITETGIDECTADLIALEVERQITAAGVQTLTAPLIRELVDAKLIEHGLEEYRKKHMRLGVPLYDAEHIIRTPNREDALTRHDPDSTDRMAAAQVKKEYALSQVFSEEVAAAHLAGGIHLHSLGFIDRFHSGRHSLGYVARFGANRCAAGQPTAPPRRPDELLAHAAAFNVALRRHFTSSAAWEAFNFYAAPFIEGMGEEVLHEFARRALFVFGPSLAAAEDGSPEEIEICWAPPRQLRDAPAIGPDGAPTGRPYADYVHTAQRLAWALLDACAEDSTGPRPTPVVLLDDDFFAAPGARNLLQHAAEVAGMAGAVQFSFDRGERRAAPSEHPWRPPFIAAHKVTLNVARAAYLAAHEADLLDRLERALTVAVQAHLQKRAFIERLFMLKDIGPLGFLAASRDGRPYIDMTVATYLVGIAGLEECVYSLTGDRLDASDDALALGMRILAHLSRLCAAHSAREGMPLALAQTTAGSIRRRLADIDLAHYPEKARAVLRPDANTHEILYTPGTRIGGADAMTPMERARIEGAFHRWFESVAPVPVTVPDSETSGLTVASFLEKIYQQTAARRIAIINSREKGA